MAYTTVSGDTLGAIAKANGTTAEAIKAANPQITDINKIGIGWVLEIPGTDAATTTESTTGSTQGLLSVGGDPEVWKVGEQSYLVYTVPDSEPPIYISWLVAKSGQDLEAIFGPDQKVVYDREMSEAAFVTTGAIDFGNTNELANFDDDPFTSWTGTMATASITQPWIMDDDYQSLVAMAMLEGRTLEEFEIAGTEWFKTHTEAEREWMVKFHGDPETAQTMLEDNRIATLDILSAAGIENPSEDLINFFADQVTIGTWSNTVFNNQIQAVADPYSGVEMLPEVAVLVGGDTGVTSEHTERVRGLVNEWLGPVYGEWTDDQINKWAGELRNDPDGETSLVEKLRSQRLASFGNYEDPNLTYQDIASPWRSFGQSVWGQKMDETSDMFIKMLQNNDAVLNGQMLRQEGINQNVGKVVQSANTAMRNSLGSTLRRAL